MARPLPVGRVQERQALVVPSRRSPWLLAWRRLRRNRAALAGAAILLLLSLAALAAPLLAPHDPFILDAGNALKPPSARYVFGTDDLGRDILSRILYGGQVSLRLGLTAVLISAVVGSTLGLLAGYYGGWLDLVVGRLVDVMLAFPGILLALVIMAALGNGLQNVLIAMGISGIPTYARLVRGSTLALKQNLYVEAARGLGASDLRIMWCHIVPGTISPVIVVATLAFGYTIIAVASLGFLGLGVTPPIPEWGQLVAQGRTYILYAPWVSTFPGLAVLLTVLATNLLGDGLREALDPRLSERGG